MTAPDVRTAAQEQAEQVWRHDQCRSDGNECVECVFRQGAFVDGAVWGAALVTPTRRQLIDVLAVEFHEGDPQSATDVVLALFSGLVKS